MFGLRGTDTDKARLDYGFVLRKDVPRDGARTVTHVMGSGILVISVFENNFFKYIT